MGGQMPPEIKKSIFTFSRNVQKWGFGEIGYPWVWGQPPSGAPPLTPPMSIPIPEERAPQITPRKLKFRIFDFGPDKMPPHPWSSWLRRWLQLMATSLLMP